LLSLVVGKPLPGFVLNGIARILDVLACACDRVARRNADTEQEEKCE